MTTQTTERVEFLRARLTERDVTIEEVWDYLILAQQPINGMQPQALMDFVNQYDITSFWQLVDWWDPVPDKPTALANPTIQQFCYYLNYTPGTKPVTFSAAMITFYERAVAHCATVNVDPANTGESEKARKKRLNAERMRETRGHRRVPDKKLKHDDILATQVRELEAQREALKSEMETVKANFTAEVKAHQDAMIHASEQRRASELDYKKRIADINTKIHSMT